MFIKDSEFIRGNCPMTKEEVRILTIGKMNLQNNSVVLDIGTGTGSITVQAGKIAEDGQVYSIERDSEALDVAYKNIEKFNCKNVILERGNAKDILNIYKKSGLKFDSIFIGGSGGELIDIIEFCNDLLKEYGALVMNFITLDNLYLAVDKIKSLGYKVEITAVNISKNIGDSYMMKANNPIYIVKYRKGEAE